MRGCAPPPSAVRALLRAAGHYSVRRGTATCVGRFALTQCSALSSPHTLRAAPPHSAQPRHTTRSTPTAGGRFAAPHPSPSVYIRKYLHLYSYICKRLYVQLFAKATNLTPSFTFVYHHHSAAHTVPARVITFK